MKSTESKGPRKTRQWLRYEIYEAMERTSRLRADFETTVEIIDRGEKYSGAVVLVEITIRNVGKTVFLARYTNFLITAMETLETMKESPISNNMAIGYTPGSIGI